MFIGIFDSGDQEGDVAVSVCSVATGGPARGQALRGTTIPAGGPWGLAGGIEGKDLNPPYSASRIRP